MFEKKLYILFFEYNVGDQIKHTKLNKKQRNYIPFTKFCYGQRIFAGLIEDDFYRIFLRQFEELKRTCAGLHMHVWLIFKEGGLIWPHIAKVSSKLPYGKKSARKFAARPFFLLFHRINRVRILCFITFSKIYLKTSFKCQKIPQFMNYFYKLLNLAL